jgi:hypothetical protein
MKLALTFVAAFAFASAASADLLWDNYDTDGSNGYSMADASVFGAQRALLDDFEVPDGGWVLQDFHALMLWNSSGVGKGTDFVLEFRPDIGGAPDPNPGIQTTGHIYSEELTGRNWFSRQEVELSLQFDDVALDPGIWWWWGYVVGPENAFMMVDQTTVLLSECWVDYDDFSGLVPGSTQFGVEADLAFQITGIPAPGALALLGLAGLVSRRRR